jgi:predicted porin
MKRNIIIALFALICSSVAVAQSNVQIYGTLEQTMEFTTKNQNGAKNTNMDSGDSKIGFRVTEDLASGLKAFAGVEFDVKAEGNSTVGNDGQAFVGLSSTSLGSIKAGQFKSFTSDAAYSTIKKFEGRGPTAVKDVKLNNTVSYLSPSYYGFSAGVSTTTNGQNGTAADRQYLDGNEYALNYNNGGFNAALAYLKTRTANGTPETANTFLGASYAFDAFDVNGAYEHDDTGVAAKNIWTVGGGWKVTGSNTLRAAYSTKVDNYNTYTLEGVHSFSKRTAVYANWQAQNGKNTTPDVNVLGMGIRHNF